MISPTARYPTLEYLATFPGEEPAEQDVRVPWLRVGRVGPAQRQRVAQAGGVGEQLSDGGLFDAPRPEPAEASRSRRPSSASRRAAVAATILVMENHR